MRKMIISKRARTLLEKVAELLEKMSPVVIVILVFLLIVEDISTAISLVIAAAFGWLYLLICFVLIISVRDDNENSSN